MTFRQRRARWTKRPCTHFLQRSRNYSAISGRHAQRRQEQAEPAKRSQPDDRQWAVDASRGMRWMKRPCTPFTAASAAVLL